MFQRFAFLFFAFAASAFISIQDVQAQYCIGHTAYIIRDETGKFMTVPELENLAIKINGIDLKWHRPTADQNTIVYQFEHVMNYDGKLRRYIRNGGELRNPLGFGIDPPAFCGAIGDLVIKKSGKEMRLIFDIGEHNTHYQIDSLPFQPGIFYLTGTKCSDGAAPPMIDNNTVGKCLVAADNWKVIDKNWERRVRSNEHWVLGKEGFDCSKESVGVINTQKELAEIVGRFSVAGDRSNIPVIDFKTEVVLARYLYAHLSGREIGSYFVDANGDVTIRGFRPQKGTPPPGSRCEIIFDVIYRSGIKTIDSKPLPPVSERDLIPLGPDPFLP